jgi:hypothetical protein
VNVVPRKLAIVLLVVLVLLLVIPLGIGMAMGVCPDCGTTGTTSGFAVCVTLVAGLFVTVSIHATRFRIPTVGPPGLGFTRSLERPPRLV